MYKRQVQEQAETVQAVATEMGGENFEWASTPEERTRLWTARHKAYFAGLTPHPGRRNATFTMTAAGLLAMQVCGEYESPLVVGAADWLLAHPPNWKERFCMYGTYYYAQGMYQRGGEYAQTAGRLVQEMLLEKQPTMEAIIPPEGVAFEPAVVTTADARKLLELVIVSIEAKRSDWMESLDFDLRLDSEALWLLPAERQNDKWKILLKKL
mgnify:CR=1 FL=1